MAVAMCLGEVDELLATLGGANAVHDSLERPRGARTASTRTKAVLPYVHVRDALARHPLVTHFGLSGKKVYNVLLEMVAIVEGKQHATPPAAPRPPPAPCSSCCAAEVVADRCETAAMAAAQWICRACGGVQGCVIDRSNPYRFFEEDRYDGKPDPSHWSLAEVLDEWGQDLDAWEEAELMMQAAFDGRASQSNLSNVRALLRKHKHAYSAVTNRIHAAVAAWMVEENPNLRVDGLIGPRSVAHLACGGACGGCGQTFFRNIDARTHRCGDEVMHVAAKRGAAKRARATGPGKQEV